MKKSVKAEKFFPQDNNREMMAPAKNAYLILEHYTLKSMHKFMDLNLFSKHIHIYHMFL